MGTLKWETPIPALRTIHLDTNYPNTYAEVSIADGYTLEQLARRIYSATDIELTINTLKEVLEAMNKNYDAEDDWVEWIP